MVLNVSYYFLMVLDESRFFPLWFFKAHDSCLWALMGLDGF